MPISESINLSRQHEMRIYLASMRAMYENAVLQNGEVYDLAFALTSGFRAIDANAILADSRIIRILRYAVAPSISQMKFGQLFGLSTIELVERTRITGGKLLAVLGSLAPKVAAFANDNIDRTRFAWLDVTLDENSQRLTEEFAKKWTCSIIADQNAQTQYRNWRKAQQEAAIERVVIESGYVRSTFRGTVAEPRDINLGEYSKERKVKGATLQKADLVVRRRRDGKLILIEAKAVGVQVDAFKRVKECCDKSRDWTSNESLGEPQVVVVIGGFFTEQNIAALRKANIHVVWEHNLDALREHLGAE